MGWFGTAFLAAVIGFAGWRFHPARGGRHAGLVIGAAIVAGLVVKLAGNASGAFSDGQSLEWLATVLSAIAVVALLGRTGRDGCDGRDGRDNRDSRDSRDSRDAGRRPDGPA
jgi:hypothetical protein